MRGTYKGLKTEVRGREMDNDGGNEGDGEGGRQGREKERELDSDGCQALCWPLSLPPQVPPGVTLTHKGLAAFSTQEKLPSRTEKFFSAIVPIICQACACV